MINTYSLKGGEQVDKLQEIFNNREIAVGIWLFLFISISIFTKPGKNFLKSVLPILFCRKFVIFYMIFLSYFYLVIVFLQYIGFWSSALLKDTIFWILFVELPLFVKAIKNATDNHFFAKLIKDNMTIVVIFQFFIGFWTFDLLTEILLVPLSFWIGCTYFLTTTKRKYTRIKKYIERLFFIFGIVTVMNSCGHLFQRPSDFLNFGTLQELLLPFILLVFNLPVVYGLALCNVYELVFIRFKRTGTIDFRNKLSVIKFAGVNLYKVTAILHNQQKAPMFNLTGDDMKEILKNVNDRLSMRIGDNYMKRAYYYVIWCIIGFILSVCGIIICNFQGTFRDFVTLNFKIDILRIKEILTYICCSGIVVSFSLLIYSLGFKKKKNEEISKIKGYSLHNFLYLVKRQYNMLQEYPPIDEPKILFVQYITIAYEIKKECDHSIETFENLLTSWELEETKKLQTILNSLIFNIGIRENEFNQFTIDKFNDYYLNKKATALQNEEINIFVSDIEKGIKEYSEQIKTCIEEFKHYY